MTCLTDLTACTGGRTVAVAGLIALILLAACTSQPPAVALWCHGG